MIEYDIIFINVILNKIKYTETRHDKINMTLSVY